MGFGPPRLARYDVPITGDSYPIKKKTVPASDFEPVYTQGVHTLLIVDDDTTLRKAIARRFRRDWRALEASNGQMALDILRGGEHVDLIICDLEMPVMNGVEFLCVKAQEFPGIPLILSSGAGFLADVARRFDCQFFPKGADPATLTALVDQFRQHLP